jgi:hypothetical protein
MQAEASAKAVSCVRVRGHFFITVYVIEVQKPWSKL